MRRQRSVSFYAETEDEYIEEYNRRKSISERRRYRPRSYEHSDEENSDTKKNNEYKYKKKFFQSYDDLELDQLGVNSTFQITTIEKEDSEDNEGGLIQKINNINTSFKQNNNNSFFSNLAPFTKNIIGPLESKANKKKYIKALSTKNIEIENNENISNIILNNLKRNKTYAVQNNNDEKSDNDDKSDNEEKEKDDDYENLMGVRSESYQMGYLALEKQEDSNIIKRERNNSIIENNCINDENISFMDNININELNNSNSLYYNNNDNINNNNQIENIYKLDSPNKNNLNNNISYSYNENNFESNKNLSDDDNSKNNINNDKNDDKKMRRYTFDINAFFPDNNYHKEGEENDTTPNQNKTLQNFICKNEFLSKNIDFVDEHLKFLLTGSDIKTKHLFLNQLLNKKINYEDNSYESFNICKKVIKLLGDYIKLEIYEENCSLCYSHMLNTYIDFSDGVILIINMNISSSAKYIYDIIDKLKYKINKDKRHFNTILLCFQIIIDKDYKDINSNKEQNESINNINDNNADNEKDIADSKNIINKIKNDFDIRPNYITFNLNKKGNYIKNEKFESVINKFLSLAYLKKERKRRITPNKNVKKHKRGMTGL